MNKRINKLFGQAMDQAVPETWTTLTHSQLSILKDRFAELIVRECADAADMAQDADCKYVGDYVAEYMGYGQPEGVTEWRANG
jgi:hypothetical protein